MVKRGFPTIGNSFQESIHAGDLMTDFHLALGQYKVYQMLLEKTAPEYDLYLAIDDITYNNFFKREGINFLVQSSQIKFFVVNIDNQEIVQWLS
jgi:hypothetical protein